MKNWEIIETDLNKLWNHFYIEYVSIYADEPLTGLSIIELEKILSSVEFSKNKYYNNCIKVLLKMHSAGRTDKEISVGLSKLNIHLSENLISQIRFKALKKINEVFGSEIGLITLLWENFHNLND